MDVDLNAAFSCAISAGFTITGRMSGPDKANHCCKPMRWDLAPQPLLLPQPPQGPTERESQESPWPKTNWAWSPPYSLTAEIQGRQTYKENMLQMATSIYNLI